ncbi:hypothetical protein CERSUDRAFT_47410 [Gelatoporia subvermispora B]|uniref:Uncharacterized protein n=1 Tax=Ceriporiopsis subvermispora (strain B) TaxID=914234 RepID=M2PRA8_CERS8|nr:hypothetical protein CERSUDRAFT_47410 [Gelatoporia subvermispora B]
MDAAVTPPLRIQTTKSTPISSQVARAHVQNFLSDFEQRASATSGGDSTVIAQLRKVADALREERDAVKKTAESS